MTRTRRILHVSAVAAALALLPVAYSSTDGIAPNDACAAGTCCFQPGALCTDADPPTPNYYNKGCDGPCGRACPE